MNKMIFFLNPAITPTPPFEGQLYSITTYVCARRNTENPNQKRKTRNKVRSPANRIQVIQKLVVVTGRGLITKGQKQVIKLHAQWVKNRKENSKTNVGEHKTDQTRQTG